MQLGNLISDALEWSFPIGHAVQDTAKGPHVSFGAYLYRRENKMFDIVLNQNQLLRKLNGLRRTFDRAFPGCDEVSLMASGGM